MKDYRIQVEITLSANSPADALAKAAAAVWHTDPETGNWYGQDVGDVGGATGSVQVSLIEGAAT